MSPFRRDLYSRPTPKEQNVKTTSSILAAFAALANLLHAEIITVDNRPDAVAMFSDLGAAITAAANGDTIQIAGSRF